MCHCKFSERKISVLTEDGWRHACFTLTMWPAKSYRDTVVTSKDHDIRRYLHNIIMYCSNGSIAQLYWTIPIIDYYHTL